MSYREQIEVTAPAKINLSLDVLGRRGDGYHEVRMVMQSIRLSDRVRIHRIAGKDIVLRNSLAYLPGGKGNLAYDAAVLFREETGIQDGIFIEVDKNIPVAAGLAGGSTDGAAVLCGLNELFETGLSEEKLREMGLRLGADVPFCIMGGTALAEGIGEKLTKLKDAPKFHVLLVKPSAGVSTKEVYTRLDAMESITHPDIDGMLRAIEEGSHLGVASKIGNVLEPVTRGICPEIADIERAMKSFGCEGVQMSGSGPTVFGLFADKDRAKAAYMHFKVGALGAQTFLTEFLR
ncbi:MAG: 4-(cytidine 5'-diphospho)-2-C-methyl-D-erythritol kinase [Lachnospiraceae bacterium]|nr:4-(cytidine 5'-diphospho)-2-C-methyl-D-erythritol kinase [Lachnospiraceae bacterium]